MSTNYNKLLNNLEELKLYTMRENLSTYIDMVTKEEKTPIDALYEMTEKEIMVKKERATIACIKTAGFPFNKTLSDYNFNFQPSVSKSEMEDFATLRFIEKQENILFIGSPGVGKTHLATAIGIEAANLFFQLISLRYKQKSTIITTNKNLSKWTDIFCDPVIANAILDRLLHHSHVINIVGPSYRTKDILEALEE